MAILDEKGRVIDAQWMVPCLFEWLSKPRFRLVLRRRRRATADGIRVLGGLLHASFVNKVPVDPEILRKEMLNILQDRACRIAAARLVIVAEAEQYLADPDNHAPPRSQAEVRAELQAIREQLERDEESEKLVIRPW